MTTIDGERTIQLLEELIRINSVNPSLVPNSPGEADIANYIAEYLEDIGIEVKIEEIQPSRSNVVGVLRGVGGGRTLLLNGHTDTVGIDYMSIDPLEPTVKDDKIYGRGSVDMKGGLASCIAAITSLIDSGIELKGDIIFAGVCDEEYASIGTEHLMRDLKADAAIVAEPTSMNIQIAHKGFTWSKYVTHGVAAHGSRYLEGVDAIAKMGKILTEIEALGKSLQIRHHKLVGPASVHASIIEGGRELSTYPDSCTLQIERRLIPGETKEDVENEARNLLEELSQKDPKFKAEHEITFYRGPMEISSDEEISKVLTENAKKNDVSPSYIGGSGWMDTEIIWSKGIPCVAFGPKGKGAHAAVEYVELSSVIKTASILRDTIIQFCERY